MDKVDDITSRLLSTVYGKQNDRFVLSVAVIVGRTVEVFEDIPFTKVNIPHNNAEDYFKIDDSWLDSQ